MTDERDEPDEEREPTPKASQIVGDEEPALRFGPDDTGPLPHWTEPPTGEVPQIFADEPPRRRRRLGGFSGQAPVWRDDQSEDANADLDLTPLTGGPAAGRSRRRWRSVRHRRGLAARRAPDDSDGRRRPASRRGSRRSAPGGRHPTRPAPVPADRRAASSAVAPPAGTCPMAIAVGFGLAALFLLLLELRRALRRRSRSPSPWPWPASSSSTRSASKGYQPAQFIGLAAIVGLPLAAYWVGVAALPLLVFLAFVATASGSWPRAAWTAVRCRTPPSPCSASSTSGCSAPTRR